MTLWAWRTTVGLLGLVLAVLLSVPMRPRWRAIGVALTAVALVGAILAATIRKAGHLVLEEFAAHSSILHWTLLIELIGALAWLLVLSRQHRQSGRLFRAAAIASLASVLGGSNLYHRYIQGIRREVADIRQTEQRPEPLSFRPSDWPCWRGPLGTNAAISNEHCSWTSPAQAVWTTEVPGKGHSSPCVVGDFVFVTTSQESSSTQSMLALDRRTGKRLWERVVHTGLMAPKHARNSYASPSPCCDGQRVFAVFSNSDSVFATALDIGSGKVIWHEQLRDYLTPHNLGASPALCDDFLIVAAESGAAPCVIAVLRHSGKLAWRTRLRLDEPSYASPIVRPHATGNEVILPTRLAVAAIDAGTGAPRWSFPWKNVDAAATAVFDNNRIVATGRYETLCISVSDGTEPCVAWRSKKAVGYVPSPLLLDDLVFLITDEGIAICLDANSGATIWKVRLGGSFSASPILAKKVIYAVSERGKVFAFQAASEFRMLTTFDISQPVHSTPVMCGDHVLVRTESSLICFQNRPSQPTELSVGESGILSTCAPLDLSVASDDRTGLSE